MRFFTLVLDPGGRGISNRLRRTYEIFPRQRGLQYQWQSFDGAAALTGWDDEYADPLLVRDGDWLAVGTVRLDNVPEMERWVGRGEGFISDLALVRRIIAERGNQYVSRFLGDFAFVVWDGRSRSAVAACDAFGVQRLYYAARDGLVAFASRAEALADGNEYDAHYLAEIIAQRPRPREISIYAGVRQLPHASIALLRPSRFMAVQQYWDASNYRVEQSWVSDEHEATQTCRHLLMESIQLRMGREGETWAQLSGGMDSSSIVSCAQWLAWNGGNVGGLAGTVTFVDRGGTGTDEREYSDEVVAKWRVPNVTIVDPPTWFDTSYSVPRLDQPNATLQIYPRDQRLSTAVRQAGGRVLLTGSGGDQLFSGNMLFFADLIVRGRLSYAIREMARRAATGRVSFWQLAYRNALLPLLPRGVHARLVHDQDQVPVLPWLNRLAMKRLGLAPQRAAAVDAYGGRLGSKYHYAVTSMIHTIENHYYGGPIADALDVRHPFLYRPLVEFALRLPPQLRARPHAHRWILRQAMRGILPDKVRTRVGKPGTDDFLTWSLATEHERLATLLRAPILGDLGLVEPAKLRTAFHDVLYGVSGSKPLCAPLLNTLAVEAWLQLRSGRWP
jgi:asparagine synthase (glutamine-hydrolysing)